MGLLERMLCKVVRVPNILGVSKVFAVILRFVLSCGSGTSRNSKACDGSSRQHRTEWYIESRECSFIMRKKFTEYYRPQNDEFAEKFKKCVFSFDTNVLLNLYRYTQESRNELIKFLQVVKDRVWLTHQAGIEYQRRRVDVFLNQLKTYDDLGGIINEAIDKINKLRRSSLFAINTLIDNIEQDLRDIINTLEEKKELKPDLMTGDPIFQSLTELFDGKVGDPYQPERYNEIYNEGKERYQAKTPPGYKDSKSDPKDINQYGDLVLWFQLLDYAKNEERPIIFITDDAKEDWWRIEHGEKLGPRPELIREFISKTGENKWLYLYSTEQLLKHAKEYLKTNITEELIKEAERIDQHDVEEKKLTIKELFDAIDKTETANKIIFEASRFDNLSKIFEPSTNLSDLFINKPNLADDLAKLNPSSLFINKLSQADDLAKLKSLLISRPSLIDDLRNALNFKSDQNKENEK